MTDRPIRVLMVSKLPPPQGGISITTELLLRKSAQHADVELEMVDIATRWRGVHQIEAWRRAVGGTVQMIRDCYRFWRSIHRRRPDIIYLNTPGSMAMLRDIVMLRIGRFYRLRSAFHIHFGRVPDLLRNGGWEWALCRHALALSTTVIALDERTFQAVKTAFPGKNVLKIPNCLDREELDRVSAPVEPTDRKPGLPRVTYIGWVIPTKGVLELVQAAAKVAAKIPFELEIIGPEKPDYSALMRQAGASMGHNLIFRGEQPHPRAMQSLRQTDIFCLPSYTEGFSIAVMEAMALGKPVIGTDVGAIAEMLRDESGDCGVVVPPRDVPALECALITLLSDTSKCLEMGCRARRIFDSRYSLDAVFQRLKQVWHPL